MIGAENDYTMRIELTPITGSDGKKYVQEVTTGKIGTTLWGPIPDDKVRPFMDERVAWFKVTVQTLKDRFTSDMESRLGIGYDQRVVADQAGTKSALPNETAGRQPGPVAEGGAEPPSLHETLDGDQLDRMAEHWGVTPREPGESDLKFRARISRSIVGSFVKR